MAGPKPTMSRQAAAPRARASRQVVPPKASIQPQAMQRQDDHAEAIRLLGARVAELEEQLAKLQQVISMQPGSNELTLYANGNINIHANAGVQIDAAGTLSINAVSLDLNSAVVQAAGVIRCDTLVAKHVDAASYTPGAGNVW